MAGRGKSLSPLASGTPAPPFALPALVTGRTIGPAACAGTPLLLLFQTYQTVDPARHVIIALRRRYGAPEQLIIANVVDLRHVPRLMRSVARNIMEGAYAEAAASLPPDVDPADHLILLPDWDGRVLRAYRFRDVGTQIGLALIDGDGRVFETYQGDDPLATAFNWLAGLLSAH